MFPGNWLLVITLWLITVSAAMWPTSALGKLVPLRMSSFTLSMSWRSIVSGRAWSSMMIRTREGLPRSPCLPCPPLPSPAAGEATASASSIDPMNIRGAIRRRVIR